MKRFWKIWALVLQEALNDRIRGPEDLTTDVYLHRGILGCSGYLGSEYGH